MKELHGIYVPGLGDHRSLGQDNAIKSWHRLGIDLEYFPLGWGDGELFEAKLTRLLNKIDEICEANGPVVLIGASAGASAVINAYCQRKNKIKAVVYICGKIQNPQTIGDDYYQKNPAFRESMQILGNNLPNLTDIDKAKIISVIPLHDGLIQIQDTKIKGVKEIKIPSIGHIASIAYAITLGKRKIIKALKNLQ